MTVRTRISKTGAGLQRAIDSLENPNELLEEVGEILTLSTIQRITTTKTAPDGKAWPAWATSTLLARTRKGNAGQGLLNDSGGLGESIVWAVKGKTVEITSTSPIAPYLQNGTPNMPARPFLGLSKDDMNAAHKATVEYFRRKRK